MRGQVGLEFFLILGFCLAMLTILISDSEREITENEKLDTAVLSLSALYSVSNAINIVALQGNGAQLAVSAFVPSKSKCYLPVASEQRLACDIGDAYGRRVYGMRLMAMPDTKTARTKAIRRRARMVFSRGRWWVCVDGSGRMVFDLRMFS